jgi:uncharacterized protein YqjF (DUF2071 family)
MAAQGLLEAPPRAAGSPSERARERMLALEGGPLFLADWDRSVFLHYRVPPEALQPHVPYPLDLHGGFAHVTLVAFTMRGMRPARGGRLGALLVRPIATHGFLNVRTYVRFGEERGIYFVAEWHPNLLARLLGPLLFGLPYRLGRLDYRHGHEGRVLRGRVVARDAKASVDYQACLDPDLAWRSAAPGSLDEFLLERYVAFTARRGVRRFFRVWHPPWPMARVLARVRERGILRAAGPWARHARFEGAHYSPGVAGVWMGRPHVLDRRGRVTPDPGSS